MENQKVLIIGLDGGTWSVLKPAMDEGYMPYLKSMVDSGASGVLESTIPPITPAAWGSFQTGCNPGKNGVFEFSVWDKNTKTMKISNSKSLPITIWKAASDAGNKVGIVNVPMTYPPSPVNGFMVTGLLTPSLDSVFTYPPSLGDELLKVVPNYEILTIGTRFSVNPLKNPDKFLKQMNRNIQNRTKAAKYLINKEKLDLFMVHFQASDFVQHALWCYLDLAHPQFDEEKKNLIFENFYQQLDNAIKEVRQTFEIKAGGDFLTFIVSDHGFQSHYKSFNLANWLYEKEYLSLDPRSFQKPLLKRLINSLDRRFNIKNRISKRLADNISNKLDIGGGNNPLIDWIESVAFSYGKSNDGFIYLLESDSTRFNELATKISEELKQIKDPETGVHCVTAVHRKEDIYSGNHLGLMPDLVVEPSPGYSFNGNYEPGKGLFHKIEPIKERHLGKHHKDGVILAVGNGIQPQNEIQAQLVDMAPTILYCFGIPSLENMDGRIITELFTDAYAANRKKLKETSMVLSGKEKKVIKRLKSLSNLSKS